MFASWHWKGEWVVRDSFTGAWWNVPVENSETGVSLSSYRMKNLVERARPSDVSGGSTDWSGLRVGVELTTFGPCIHDAFICR